MMLTLRLGGLLLRPVIRPRIPPRKNWEELG